MRWTCLDWTPRNACDGGDKKLVSLLPLFSHQDQARLPRLIHIRLAMTGELKSLLFQFNRLGSK